MDTGVRVRTGEEEEEGGEDGRTGAVVIGMDGRQWVTTGQHHDRSSEEYDVRSYVTAGEVGGSAASQHGSVPRWLARANGATRKGYRLQRDRQNDTAATV